MGCRGRLSSPALGLLDVMRYLSELSPCVIAQASRYTLGLAGVDVEALKREVGLGVVEHANMLVTTFLFLSPFFPDGGTR